ncbi:hypothetical protein [Devosia sp. 2618]|uniref:hypothetical protein n=1 Tax=Devosia sp. 2618 TaxID=3156454 RepID=UPI0033990280
MEWQWLLFLIPITLVSGLLILLIGTPRGRINGRGRNPTSGDGAASSSDAGPTPSSGRHDTTHDTGFDSSSDSGGGDGGGGGGD